MRARFPISVAAALLLVKDGRDTYFFANSTEKAVDTKVVPRGKKSLAIWNPHSGEKTTAQSAQTEAQVTTLRLALPPVSSLFYVQEQ